MISHVFPPKNPLISRCLTFLSILELLHVATTYPNLFCLNPPFLVLPQDGGHFPITGPCLDHRLPGTRLDLGCLEHGHGGHGIAGT